MIKNIRILIIQLICRLGKRGKAVPLCSDIRTVSYTHLDVYKRQVIWIACIFVIMRILRNRTALSFSGKAVGAAAVIVCMAAALWFSKDIVPDLAAGPQTAILTDIQLSGTQAHTGIFSHHYYLLGIDPQGEKIRVEISGQDYERLETAGSVLIEYYPNTKRAVKLLPV